jgi:hypothetical protein
VIFVQNAIDGVIYDTETATLLARDANYDDLSRPFAYTELYRSPKGHYFKAETLSLMPPSTKLARLSLEEAIKEFNELPNRLCDFREAFPDAEFADA